MAFNGQPPIIFYGFLRNRFDELVAADKSLRSRICVPGRPGSERQWADYLGINRSTFSRILKFYRANKEMVWRAAASHDWTEIEVVFFGRFGAYKSLPLYQAALNYGRLPAEAGASSADELRTVDLSPLGDPINAVESLAHGHIV